MTGTKFRASVAGEQGQIFGSFTEACGAADRMAIANAKRQAVENVSLVAHVDEYTGEIDNRSHANGWKARRATEARQVAGEWRALDADGYVRVSLEIENRYELAGTIVTRVEDVEIPGPPTLDEGAQDYQDWAYDFIYCFTGTGITWGDSWYDVTVTGSSLPELVGRTIEWGY